MLIKWDDVSLLLPFTGSFDWLSLIVFVLRNEKDSMIFDKEITDIFSFFEIWEIISLQHDIMDWEGRKKAKGEEWK